MQRRGAEQDGDVQAFAVHGFELRRRVVIARHREVVAVRHLFLAVIDDIGDGAHLLTAANGELHAAMFAVALAPGNEVAPFGVHVLVVQIGRVIDMHVAVESLQTVFSHDNLQKRERSDGVLAFQKLTRAWASAN